MPLDTEVDKQPSTMRTAAEWMAGAGTAVDGAIGVVTGTRGESEGAWPSHAGDSFREMSHKTKPGIEDTSNAFTDFANVLREHADQIDTVTKRMEQARELAVKEGLDLRGFLIMEPGPEPPTPAPLPSDQPATPEQTQAHAEGTRAVEAFAKQAEAYAGCSTLVQAARKTEHGAVATLNRFLGGLVEKSPFNATDVLTGLAGAHAGATAKLRAKATKLAASGSIEITERMMHNPSMSLAGQTKAAMIHIERTQELREANRQALGSRVAGWVDKLSPRTKEFLQASLAKPSAGSSTGFVRGATRVGSKLPVVGLTITASGVGYDLGQGKDPATAVASGAGSYLAGSATSSWLLAMGTPVTGAVIGAAAVGVGVGFAIEEWGPDAFDKAVQIGEKLEEINPKMTR